ncbi:MAG: Hsp20/alpha crystallin family protein [Elainellaceae cyanobacterium]
MLTQYWQPFREMEIIRRQLDHVFDEIAASDTSNGLTSMWTPPAELIDDGEFFTLKLQVPGIDPENLDIQASRDAIAISGDYRPDPRFDEGRGDRSEFRYGKFRRVIPLADAIDNGRIEADYRHGILWLTLPKAVEVFNPVVRVSLVQTDEAAVASDDAVGTTPIEGKAVTNGFN